MEVNHMSDDALSASGHPNHGGAGGAGARGRQRWSLRRDAPVGGGAGGGADAGGRAPLSPRSATHHARAAAARAADAAVDVHPLYEAVAGIQDREGGRGAAEGGHAYVQLEKQERYHEVQVVPVVDPLTGATSMLIVQSDVTSRVVRELRLVKLTETQLAMLENMFPRHVLELMVSGVDDFRKIDALAGQHNDVTLLFLDIAGFTSMSKDLQPQQVLEYLNLLFRHFDEICTAHGVYNLDISGDCYIIVAALMTKDNEGFITIDPQPDAIAGAHALLAAACTIMRHVRTVPMPHNGQPTEIRIGMHTGSVVSGLTGTKMFKFSLYGDTVNVASRMESTGKAGCIQISEGTYALLEGAARACFEPTDGVQVKGKGHMASYIYRPGESELKLTPADLAMIAQVLTSARSLPAWGSGGGGSGGHTPSAAVGSAGAAIVRSAPQPMWTASSGDADGDGGGRGGSASSAAGAAGAAAGAAGSAAAAAAAGSASFAAAGKPPRGGRAVLTLPVGKGEAGSAASGGKHAVPSPQPQSQQQQHQQAGAPPRSPKALIPRTAHFADELTFVGGGGSGGSGGAVAASTSAHALAGVPPSNAVVSSNSSGSSQFMSRAGSGAPARATVVIPDDMQRGSDARGAARRSGRGGVGDAPSARQIVGGGALGQPSRLMEIRQITSSLREAYGAGAGGSRSGAPLHHTHMHILAGCLPPPSHAGTDAVDARLAMLFASAGRRTASAAGSTGSRVDDGGSGGSGARSPAAGGAPQASPLSSMMHQMVVQRHKSPRKLGREQGALGALLRSSMPGALRARAVGAGAHGGGDAHSVSAILIHGSFEHAPQAGGGLEQAAAAGAANVEAGPQPSKDASVGASAGSSGSSGSQVLPEAKAGPRRFAEGGEA
ncbi:hypothetical protein FOA52_015633 [Chlamydomonas sp. UWO 241]|nr:hypothetical protein FOA52_015633 [Chlamydomonas sp. UWO 241]